MHCPLHNVSGRGVGWGAEVGGAGVGGLGSNKWEVWSF